MSAIHRVENGGLTPPYIEACAGGAYRLSPKNGLTAKGMRKVEKGVRGPLLPDRSDPAMARVDDGLIGQC